MNKRVNTTALAPLLDVARTDPDSTVRHAALDAATRLTLSEEAWRALADTLAAAARTFGHDSPERAAVLALAARVPLLSMRRQLRSIAAAAGDPAGATVADALADASDPSQISGLLAEAAAGRWEAFQRLATMPLERAGVSIAMLPAPPSDVVEARLWHALAAARLGECRWLDPFLTGQEPEPSIFFGSPAVPYALIAAMRPLPEVLVAHLRALLPQIDKIDEPARERMARIVMGAATGSTDADGAPIEARDNNVVARPSQQQVADALEAARSFLGQATVSRIAVADLSTEGEIGPLVAQIVADANTSAKALAADAPANQIIGNAIVGLVGVLPRTDPWPAAALVFAHLRAVRPALDDEQIAWVVSRAPSPRWVGDLAALLTPPERPQAERLRILRIAMAAADHAAGRGQSPARGSGGAGPRAPTGRGELIEDEVPAMQPAGAGPVADSRDELAIGVQGPAPAMPASTGDGAKSAPHAASPVQAPQPASSNPKGDAAVFCPPVVGRATVFLVQLLLYPPDRAAEARDRALEADASAQRRGVLALPPDLPLGTVLDLHLEMPALRVDEPDASLAWTGDTTAAQFEVAVPPDAAIGNTTGRVRLSIAGVPAGTLRFQLAVAAEAPAQPPRDANAEIKRYHRAFVSYSSSDRAEVLRRVQAFRIAGISVFQDVLDLEPGQRWERELYREIDRCDVFLLFWSSAAAASPWVTKEIDYALSLKQGDDEHPPDIAPVPIEGPPIPPPPERLRHLHFNDALLAHIAAAKWPPKG